MAIGATRWLVQFCAVLLLGCGQGSQVTVPEAVPPILNGIFIDSPVFGLKFETVSVSGETDVRGTFYYRENEIINFFIGDLFLGRTQGKPVISPLDFYIDESETNAWVTNTARFLQTIDSDQRPSNGIKIEADLVNDIKGMSINFRQEIEEFERDPNVIQVITSLSGSFRDLVPADVAQAHLRASLISPLIGHYQGTLSGDDSGTWQLNLDQDGNISGSVFYNGTRSTHPLSGIVSSNGFAELQDENQSLIFEAEFRLSGNVTGTWSNLESEKNGVFSGTQNHAGNND